MIQILLAFAGVLFGFGIAKPGIALVYPPLAALMAIGWAQNDSRIWDLGTYLRGKIEPSFEDLGWETRLQTEREAATGQETATDQGWRRIAYSHGGLFIGTQGIALGIGLANFSGSLVEWVLLATGVLSIPMAFRTIEKTLQRTTG